MNPKQRTKKDVRLKMSSKAKDDIIVLKTGKNSLLRFNNFGKDGCGY
ncbi:MAG: hypothetical protein UU18_C0022G0001 [Parcubacteria group bacterium GW2011_GWB2_40_8]|nr:MAG: hypothetical protein UT71_C0006G0002 [Parcubacteria group bacterium GW2011_GWF2_40_10]KKR47324.1 MAG: hypothetical protein UT83_C0011G0008 [Parcubacteria group bacterium GW2011_GWA2_40_143]KKR59966.1 MAG: hypothetical protein UT97_C0007G0002 [Parcubacteria group bacterium GW2011_GWC2_40_31]KKR74610.1 MAG: hypothetical protein UU18_C0022G0001 [Parcubacteria group bacterium GW2011_GWB2_40_8]KKR83066.1 MAG: hypothetical protein UU28_C0004G0002 [Parcubacteria group bacterium GW2011_GWD2_40_